MVWDFIHFFCCVLQGAMSDFRDVLGISKAGELSEKEKRERKKEQTLKKPDGVSREVGGPLPPSLVLMLLQADNTPLVGRSPDW